MSDATPEVLIAGAGLAGSALACALGEAGVPVVLVDPASAPVTVPATVPADVTGFDARVSALTADSRSFLRSLDVWPAIEAAGVCPFTRMWVADAEGTGTIEFDAATVPAGDLGVIVENRVTLAALHRRLSSLPTVQWRSGVSVETLEARLDAPEGQRVCLSDGSEWLPSLLVGADGALSRVRDLTGLETREWDYHHEAIVTTLEVTRSHGAVARQWFWPEGPLAFLPLPDRDGRHFVSIVWSCEPERAAALMALDEAAFVEAATVASEAACGPVRACAPRVRFPLRQRHARQYTAPGVALVADAAHTIHPLAGQGINLGFRDVAVLAEEVCRARDRGLAAGDHSVLARYQRRRQGDNLRMMAVMEGFKRLFAARALPVRWLRNVGLRGVDRVGPLKRRLMREAMGLK